MRRQVGLLLGVIVLAAGLLPAGGVLAQGGEAVGVEIEASDGLVLVGDYYAPLEAEEGGAPAVLLLHQLSSTRRAWADLIPLLPEAGYGVLAVDMRGHGATRGSQDWPLAEQDLHLWLDWLRAQEGIDPARLNIIGASIGSNLALRGMAGDEAVVTAIALSPGLDYRGVTTEDALETIDRRPVMLVAGQSDYESANSVRELGLLLKGDSLMRLYATSTHGTAMLADRPTLMPLIVNWLEEHNR